MRLFTRRKVLGLATCGIASVPAALGYGFLVEPELLSVTRKDISVPNLPPDLDGLKVAMFADLHYQPEADEGLVQRLVQTTNAEQPDVVAIVGDYMDHDEQVIPPLLDQLALLQPKHGTYAVVGNHDGWNMSRHSLAKQFRAKGIDFLINQHSKITIKGSTLAIAGTDNVWDGNPDPKRTFHGIPSNMATLALVHEPDYFDTIVQTRDSVVQFSGHSHGGQCRVPIVGYAPQKVLWGRKYLYGEFTHGSSTLFVTRGVGTTGLRVRFACRPELTLITLRSPEAGA